MQSQSITVWIELVKQGDDEAARRLWDRCFPELVNLARRRMAGVSRRMEDEEDVALSVLDSFFRAADKGRFPDLNDRHGLWRLLKRIAHRKVVDLVRRTRKRVGEANVIQLGGSSTNDRAGIELVEDIELSADIAIMFNEQVRYLLDRLPDDKARRIAAAKMDGFTNKETALKLDCALRTVERRLAVIRRIWSEEGLGS
jgi:DNA-directed RNA polymerase specialized sigma24 family protein